MDRPEFVVTREQRNVNRSGKVKDIVDLFNQNGVTYSAWSPGSDSVPMKYTNPRLVHQKEKKSLFGSKILLCCKSKIFIVVCSSIIIISLLIVIVVLLTKENSENNQNIINGSQTVNGSNYIQV